MLKYPLLDGTPNLLRNKRFKRKNVNVNGRFLNEINVNGRIQIGL